MSRFKESRDNWKAKYAQLKLRIRVVEEQARWLGTSRDKWKATAERLQAELLAQKK